MTAPLPSSDCPTFIAGACVSAYAARIEVSRLRALVDGPRVTELATPNGRRVRLVWPEGVDRAVISRELLDDLIHTQNRLLGLLREALDFCLDCEDPERIAEIRREAAGL